MTFDSDDTKSTTAINSAECSVLHDPRNQTAPVDRHHDEASPLITANEPVLILLTDLDRTIQTRVARDERTARKYAGEMTDGAQFPPIDVFQDPKTGRLWRANGEHRTWASELLGRTHILATIRSGGRREAFEYALTCDIGLPRTAADRRHCVQVAIVDPAWAHLSSRVIAAMCGVDHKTVEVARKKLVGPQPTQREGADARRRKVPEPSGEIPQSPTTARQAPLDGNKTPKTPYLENDRGTAGEIPQLKPAKLELLRGPTTAVVTKPEDQQSRAVMDSATAATNETPTPSTRHLLTRLLSSVEPSIANSVLDALQKLRTLDPATSEAELVALGLAWGLDHLTKTPVLLITRDIPVDRAAIDEASNDSDDEAINAQFEDGNTNDNLIDSIREAIGAKTYSARQILMQLQMLGTAPVGSNRLRTVRRVLMSNPKVFCRVDGESGMTYSLRDGDPHKVPFPTTFEGQFALILAQHAANQQKTRDAEAQS